MKPRQRLPKAEILIRDIIADMTEPGKPTPLTDQELSEEAGLALFTVGHAVNNLKGDGDVSVEQAGSRRKLCITEQGKAKSEGRV